MFPTGTAGASLIVLRTSVAAALVFSGIGTSAWVTPPWIAIAIAVLAFSIIVGLFTPYSCAAGCLFELYLFSGVGWRDEFHLAVSILDGVVLAFLGPGAYSVDAHLFGRKLLTLPPER
jgi:uncharacterized membrane protein YphA (DoxX/SURF4 family)